MKTRSLILGTIAAAVAAAGILTLTPPARAGSYSVLMSTSSLIGHPAGPFSLDFQLTDGDGVANNTVTLTNFVFGGGSPSGAASLLGGASGDFSGTVTLTDSSFLNEFTQGFVPGSTLSFDVNTTDNFAGGTPDAFSFAILDNTMSELPTTGPAGAFVQMDFSGGAAPVLQAYGSDPSTAPAGGGSALSIAAPTVQSVGAAAPEPGALALLASAAALPLTSLLRARSRRR